LPLETVASDRHEESLLVNGPSTSSSLTFLGSGDSQGVPRWWCDCVVCGEAKSTRLNARTRPSLILESGEGRVMVDAAPEFRLQAVAAGLRSVDAVLVTHAHNDHVLGLGDVLDWLRHTGADTRIHAPEPVMPQLEARFPYAFTGRYRDRFQPVPSRTCGWQVRAVEVPHGFNGTSFAYRFERHGRALVYCSDAIGISQDLLEAEFTGLEVLILGASFWDESVAPYGNRSVYDVREALEVIERVRPHQAVLTHLGHDVDARREAELPANVRLAADGLRLNLW
jgi:phosphoribosyl 1,2-cyclic phosphate phosphodiesterase